MSTRLDHIDATRGLLLAVMAIDHARSFLHRSHPTEIWGTPLPHYHGDLFDFVLRGITHLCAPGFFFLLGVSMVLYARSRPGESPLQHFLVRGLILVALQVFVENLAWLLKGLTAGIAQNTYGYAGGPGVPAQIYVLVGVLAALGFAMMLSSVVLTRDWKLLVGLALAAQIPPLYLANTRDADAAIPALLGVLSLPGQAGFVLIRYPVLPWLSLTLLGILYGRMLQTAPRHMELALAGALLAAFVLLRSAGIGDYNTPVEGGIIGFFNVTKYPPSPVFQLFTVSAVLLLLWGFRRYGSPRILLTFGKATLFFYIAHLYLLAAFSLAFPRGGTWPQVLLALAALLALLYFGCRAWAQFKRDKPTAHWAHYF